MSRKSSIVRIARGIKEMSLLEFATYIAVKVGRDKPYSIVAISRMERWSMGIPSATRAACFDIVAPVVASELASSEYSADEIESMLFDFLL